MSDNLYHPSFEHDSCGIGFIAQLRGRPSRRVVEDALTMLMQMEHRGGQGAEPTTGDGAGILTQLPHDFFRDACAPLGIRLPAAGAYGVGMTFFPKDEALREKCRHELGKYIRNFGLQLLGYRQVPVDPSLLGMTALQTEPHSLQFFVAPHAPLSDEALERKLVVLRKYANRTIQQLFPEADDDFYIASLSARTIIYKGMLTTAQLRSYYPDLSHPLFTSALALIHSRFSTNTFPKWKLAQPFRYLAHNGEINTINGNVNWMKSKTALFEHSAFTPHELDLLHPICDARRSDSSNLDNIVEILANSGRSLAHSMMMLVPEAYESDDNMPAYKKDFYAYHATLMEPWDGPAALVFTNGLQVGAILDRNGLRPSRYTVTTDDFVIMSSEAGALPIAPERVRYKGRLEPGKIFIADLQAGRLLSDEEVKREVCQSKPYGLWLQKYQLSLEDLPVQEERAACQASLEERLRLFGYTLEEIEKLIMPMISEGKEALGSMGADNPLAVLSEQPQHFANYFRQGFAQVSNPPIDPIRERSVMSLSTALGQTRNILDETPEHCRKIRLEQPVLTNGDLRKLRYLDHPAFKVHTLDALFYTDDPSEGLETGVQSLCQEALFAVKNGCNLLIISDREAGRGRAPIPSLMACGAVHHHLIRHKLRSNAGLVIEAGDVRSSHHFATLIGYGANAVNPYMVFDLLKARMKAGLLGEECDSRTAQFQLAYYGYVGQYTRAIGGGLLKIFSKMGISTLESYQGAQVFEPLGLSAAVVDLCFSGSLSRLGGLGFRELGREILDNYRLAYPAEGCPAPLRHGGLYHWRREGERHAMNPDTIQALQRACREGNYAAFRLYSSMLDEQGTHLRHLLDFKHRPSIPLEDVEPVENILRRFASGAMSFGSISHEAHSTLAIAMNRMGAKSNSGEGGEDPERYHARADGDSACSAIKQVASGRFGVTIQYLANAVELQIKMAQGAKPGEGGQLPGHKVDAWIGRVRHSTPGVGLISPPPHHDIYSIEDLAQLIYDLKRANPLARVSVKLVSIAGVGTIASGVVKAKADSVLIAGHDGGTGASPLSSVQHAGLPWELGLAEAHQTLVQNRLRDRVLLQTDGLLRTGRDLAVATLLGAEEWGVATAALIAQGCIMMRKCHLNTCPVGIATQNPELRKLFSGKPEHVINMFTFMAQELREIMAQLGFRTVNQMVGQAQVLKVNLARGPWKADYLQLDPLIRPAGWVHPDSTEAPRQPLTDSALDRWMLQALDDYRRHGQVHIPEREVNNTDRAIGTSLSYYLCTTMPEPALPDDSLRYPLAGAAGQSFGAFAAAGITLDLAGESNDYVGKGLSGGILVIRRPPAAAYPAADNVIIGNVALYGATAGRLFAEGKAGERFAVRNSGAVAVVEGIGDHGCEYMTGGEVLILGPVGKNFGAGMSGGLAYVYDPQRQLAAHFNADSADLVPPEMADFDRIRQLLQEHHKRTASLLARDLLNRWATAAAAFVKVYPRDYRRVREAVAQQITTSHG